jgi:hypothetical protein
MTGGIRRLPRVRRILLTVVASLLLACAHREIYRPGGPQYFSGFGCSSTLPFCPQGPIAVSDLDSRRAYIEVYFDAAGRVEHLIKRIDGQIDFEHRYFYDAEGELTQYTLQVPGEESGTFYVRP